MKFLISGNFPLLSTSRQWSSGVPVLPLLRSLAVARNLTARFSSVSSCWVSPASLEFLSSQKCLIPTVYLSLSVCLFHHSYGYSQHVSRKQTGLLWSSISAVSYNKGSFASAWNRIISSTLRILSHLNIKKKKINPLLLSWLTVFSNSEVEFL